MRQLYKDMGIAVIMGLVLPWCLLNVLMRLEQRSEPISEAAAMETVPGETALPVLLAGVEMDMEEYLLGVVLAEMPASFEEEALKAQAVAARTFARKAYVTGGKHGSGSVCGKSSCCQAYITPGDYLTRGGNMEDLQKVRRAVQETAGWVLTWEGELIEAVYFSASGGSTEDAAAVWGTDYPYLQAVDSPGERDSFGDDQSVYSREVFEELIGMELTGPPESWFSKPVYTQGGGVQEMDICGETYLGTQLRFLLSLRSTAFSVSAAQNQITFTTRGYGHRVGMSQYGADAMAIAGAAWQEILAHYYQGAELTKIS